MVIGDALVVALGGASAYLLVTRPWQTDASPSAAPPQAPAAQVEDAQDRLLALERQHLQRVGLQEVLQQAKLINEEIDALESEVGAYQKQLAEVRTSDLSKRLIENELAVRYLSDRWGDPLPPENVANHCRVRLDELIRPIREAVSEPGTSYEVTDEARNEIERIRFEVAEAQGAYAKHRQLLEAFVKTASEKPGEESRTSNSLNATGKHDVSGVDAEPGR